MNQHLYIFLSFFPTGAAQILLAAGWEEGFLIIVNRRLFFLMKE